MISIKHLKNTLRAYFSTKPEVLSVYVFGSSVTNRKRKNSDIDIALFLNEQYVEVPLRYRIEIATDLTELLRTDVDIVILNFSNLLLRAQVFEKGLLVYERNPNARALFQSISMGRYYDFKRYFSLHADRLKRKIKEIGLG